MKDKSVTVMYIKLIARYLRDGDVISAVETAQRARASLLGEGHEVEESSSELFEAAEHYNHPGPQFAPVLEPPRGFKPRWK